jgi:Tfp pilus assembly protein PilF/predicted esterase
MKCFMLLLLTLLTFSLPTNASSDKIVKDSIASQSKKRTYYLFVPENVKPSTPAPLIVLLHGSKRNGLSLVEKWKDLAKKEGVVLVGPDSADSSLWSTPIDGPDFLYELVESLKAKYPINPRRVYLFGHSAGASFALLMSLFESEYFAATAIHAGALQPEAVPLIERAKRKSPISIQVGTNDQLFPLTTVRATRDALNARGFSVELTEISGHNHWYYDLAPKINLHAWEFLKKHELAEDPRFEQHRFSSQGKRSGGAEEAYNRGIERHRAGDLSGAIAAYTRALELDPNFADVYNNRGVAYMNQGNYSAAIADLSRSIEIKPEATPYHNRGSAYRALKKLKEAIADYTRAIELSPSAETFYNRGVAHEEDGNADLALADYTRAIELNPKLARAYANRGIVLLRQGKDVEAQRDFDTAFQLDDKLRSELEAFIRQVRATRGTGRP